MSKNKDGFEAGEELTFEQVQEAQRIAKAKARTKANKPAKPEAE